MDSSLTRRAFVGTGAAVAVAATLPMPATAAVPSAHLRPTRARNYVHIFLPGGWPATELWDPKPFTPFRSAMRGCDLLSTCRSIETSAPAIRVGAGLESLAPLMHHATVIRSLVPDDDVQPHEAIDHATAQDRMRNALAFDEDSLRRASGATVETRLDHWSRMTSLPLAILQTAEQDDFVRFSLRLAFTPYEGFDAHEFGARQVAEAKRNLFAGIAQLIEGLESRGLLETTIVCVSSEFSRTVAGVPARTSDVHTGENTIIRTERDYGLHQHFAGSNSLVLFGGPFQGGYVVGRTRDLHPMVVAEHPVTLSQVRRMIGDALATS